MYPLNAGTAAELLRHWRNSMLFVEASGLFWILAELLVLDAVKMARPRIESRTFTVAPTRKEMAALLIQGVVFLFIAAVVIGRHFYGGSALILPGGAAGDASVLDRFTQFTRVHLMVWAVFIAVWVVLEGLIVYHGYLAYRSLRRMYGPYSHTSPNVAVCVLIGAALLAAVPADAEPLLSALREIILADRVYRNALYLYIRIAAVAWIVFEWTAAVILWRTWRMLAAARKRKS